MQIVLLDEARFDSYAINHPNYNYYQTSNYGKFMSKYGHNAYYLGLVDDSGKISAATLIIVKNENQNKRKMAYAPRGFLIDWDNEELVKTFTVQIKDFLSKRSFTYLKVDPAVVYKEHNIDKTVKAVKNDNFVKKLQTLGYVHMGYNDGNEASKPRWEAITKLDTNITKLYNTISKAARNKIIEAVNSGIKVYKGGLSDIELYHSVLASPIPPVEYYYDLYEFYSNINAFEIFFAKFEPAIFVENSKRLFDKEETRNNELNLKIQDWNNPDKENTINEKLQSDELLSKYKKKMIESINLFQKHPNGIIIAATAIIKYGKTIVFFNGTTKSEYQDDYPGYLLKWQIMQEYAKQGYEFVNYNGIDGSFSNDYNNLLKLELSNNIVEYVGEFDLVINKKSYYTGNKLEPILNWLNTPI